MATCKTIHGTEFEIDPEDLGLLEDSVWFLSAGEVVRWKEGKTQRLAKLIGAKPGKVLYKNGNKRDLTRGNIKIVSNAVVRLENEKHKGDAERGLVWDKRREKWQVRLSIMGKMTTLGRFTKKEEALARLEAAKAEIMLDGL